MLRSLLVDGASADGAGGVGRLFPSMRRYLVEVRDLDVGAVAILDPAAHFDRLPSSAASAFACSGCARPAPAEMPAVKSVCQSSPKFMIRARFGLASHGRCARRRSDRCCESAKARAGSAPIALRRRRSPTARGARLARGARAPASRGDRGAAGQAVGARVAAAQQLTLYPGALAVSSRNRCASRRP